MEAGRDLDALVSRHIFDTEPCTCGPIGGYDPETGICSRCGVRPSAHYSTFIGVAWGVVERMVRHHGYLFSDAEWDGRRCFAEFALGGKQYAAFADGMPEAICLAALKAVGVKVEEASLQEGSGAG